MIDLKYLDRARCATRACEVNKQRQLEANLLRPPSEQSITR